MSAPLTTQDINALIARLEQEGYNMLIPPGFLMSASPAFRVTFREHRIRSLDPKGKEVYQDKRTTPDYALSAVTLFKLGTLAGVTFDHHPERGCRWLAIQDGVMQYQAVAAIKNADGSPLVQPTSKTVFYDGRRPAEYEPEKVETKAKARAIRQLLGVKSSYTRVELEKPFAVLIVELAIDMTNPQVQLLLAQQAISTMTNVFGIQAPPAMLSPQVMPTMIPGAIAPTLLPQVAETSQVPATASWEDDDGDPSLAEAASLSRQPAAPSAAPPMAPPPAIDGGAESVRVSEVKRLAAELGLTADQIKAIRLRQNLPLVDEMTEADFRFFTTQLLPDVAAANRTAAAGRRARSGDPY
jgi:hypothetical protein